jgi:hypothetical protein
MCDTTIPEGARNTYANRPCLWETHPELAATLADPTEGWRVTKGTARKLTWRCPHNACSETHEYRVPDKIIRGNNCSQCLPSSVTDGLGDVQENIHRSVIRTVKAIGLDHCTTCDKVLGKEAMAKGSGRLCKSCASKRMGKYLKDNPDVVQRNNAIRAKRARSTKGTFSREQWQARLDYFGHKCVYCGCGGKMTLDHKIPICKGGTNWPSNFVPACKSCNSSKNAKGFLEFKKNFKKD